MARLGVNIDHVARLREIRKTKYPEPVQAALLCELAGADGITVHLREDRRHIQDRDIHLLKEIIQTRLNIEIGINDEMISMMEDLEPHSVCLVPERREEVTTEGGLDLVRQEAKIKNAILRLREKGILVSLFVNPDVVDIEKAKSMETQAIEIHTGNYCESKGEKQKQELEKIFSSIAKAKELNLMCNAGHGLDTLNIRPLAPHPDIHEFNIGHSIICRALIIGLYQAVQEMKDLLRKMPS